MILCLAFSYQAPSNLCHICSLTSYKGRQFNSNSLSHTCCCISCMALILAWNKFPSLGELSCFFRRLWPNGSIFWHQVCMSARAATEKVPSSWVWAEEWQYENKELCLTAWNFFFKPLQLIQMFKYRMTPKLMHWAIADPALWHLFHCNHCCFITSLHRILTSHNRK